MNKGILTVGIILLSLISLLVINLISNQSTGSELDYYLVKETAEASIEDAIDIKYYRDNGILRMDKDKFMESFLRRFAQSVDNTRNYDIKVYDLNEVPPKVSIKVDSLTAFSFDSDKLDITTRYDGIAEMNAKEDPFVTNAFLDENNEIGRPIKSDKKNSYVTVGIDEENK